MKHLQSGVGDYDHKEYLFTRYSHTVESDSVREDIPLKICFVTAHIGIPTASINSCQIVFFTPPRVFRHGTCRIKSSFYCGLYKEEGLAYFSSCTERPSKVWV